MENDYITIVAQNKILRLSIAEAIRWAALIEAVQTISGFSDRRGVEIKDSLLKPNAIQNYINDKAEEIEEKIQMQREDLF